MKFGSALTLNINYTSQAEADLKSIYQYIKNETSKTHADTLITRILQAVRMLESFPLLGRPGKIERTRELSISGLPYFAVYTIPNEYEIDIIAIMHTRKNYP